jgi:hypothetical protein
LLEESSYKELEFVKMMKNKVNFVLKNRFTNFHQVHSIPHQLIQPKGTPQKDQAVERKKPHLLEWSQEQQDKDRSKHPSSDSYNLFFSSN